MRFQNTEEDYDYIDDENNILLHQSKFWSSNLLSIVDFKKNQLFQNNDPYIINRQEDYFLHGSIEQYYNNIYQSQFFNQKSQTLNESGNVQTEEKAEQIEIQEQNKKKKQNKTKGKRKRSQNNNSIYHNYQKHLNNLLKKLSILPFCKGQQNYKLAATQLWKKYIKSKIKTKRFLHYIFNQKNQHQINHQILKQYGLLDCYQKYEQDTLNKAKKLLSQLVVKQLTSSLDKILLKSRMKNVTNFKQYVLNFRQQLTNGFLLRRLLISQ